MRTSLVPNTSMLTSSFRTIRKDELNYISELKTAYMNGRKQIEVHIADSRRGKIYVIKSR